MVAVMTKQIFTSLVSREGDRWVIATELPDIGIVRAEAKLDSEIEWHSRLSICDFTELKPFDFDIHFAFSGDAPIYLID